MVLVEGSVIHVAQKVTDATFTDDDKVKEVVNFLDRENSPSVTQVDKFIKKLLINVSLFLYKYRKVQCRFV